MQDNLALFFGQLAERNVRPHAHFTGDLFHQRPYQRLPRSDRAFVNRKRFIGNERGFIDDADDARSVTTLACALTVERQFFCSRRIEMHAALRACQSQIRRNVFGRLDIMSVRTAVRGKPRKHKAQMIQQFRSRAERAADAWNTGSLPQRQRRRNIQHFVHLRFFRLRHAAARVGRKRFQIPPRAFRVQNAERKRRFA